MTKIAKVTGAVHEIDGDASHGVVRRTDGPRALSRINEPNPMPTAKLEERRIIHRNESVREQANAFRELRTCLLALGAGTNFITLVVPVADGCGGSFVARNLAAAFAFDDTKSALLVDCDVRQPSQHEAFGIEANQGGLIDYLRDDAIDVPSILYRTGVPGLQLIPAGEQREVTGEVFSSQRMRSMVKALHDRYPDRYLILDGPSVLGSPDARILAELADLVVLVTGYGQVTMDAVDKAVANFDPSKLAGVVLNKRP
ncbi:P-loop NTPase family protein [Cognatilysobacter tabacisoli]|uniref:polysaccharide biosynthesis protein n=1 Tax=Cognatilysobacter tabacisoli TaxID=2315424 RepID=UPI000E6AF9C6|nr:polysaccharide biosynthesis protein [Lysobacter tabacisoli]